MRIVTPTGGAGRGTGVARAGCGDLFPATGTRRSRGWKEWSSQSPGDTSPDWGAMDRRFLVELDKAAWDSVARAVQGRVTDQVLQAGVERLPREMHQRRGAELLQALRSRRDNLLDAADGFYPLG